MCVLMSLINCLRIDYVSPVCLQNLAADNFDLDDASVDLAGWGTVYKGIFFKNGYVNFLLINFNFLF